MDEEEASKAFGKLMIPIAEPRVAAAEKELEAAKKARGRPQGQDG